MFDRDKTYQVRIKSGGIKSALLAWPTDEQWCERTRRQRIIRKQMGGAMSEPEWPDRGKVNLDLFTAIRMDPDGDSFDEFEAVEAIARLERTEVTECELTGGNIFRVVAIANDGSETVHRLKMPTARDVSKFESRRFTRIDKGRESITRASLEPAGDLYDACFVDATGYAAGQQPPIVHKVKAVFAVMEALADDEPDPE